MWWGILGLIGWAYLVAATLYVLVRDRRFPLALAIALLYGLYVADEMGTLSGLAAVSPFLNVGRALGAHAAIAVSGVLLGVMIRRSTTASWRVAGQAFLYAAALGAAGAALHALRDVHHAFWINKIWATAPWCLLSSAWTCAAWAILYVLVDVKGWRGWPRSITVAGENALAAYLIPPLLLSLFELLAALLHASNPYETLGASLALGSLRAVVFAWIVVHLCGLLRARGIRLQL